MDGKRKLIFFTACLGVAAVKLTGPELSSVIIALATGFAAANGIEHWKKK